MPLLLHEGTAAPPSPSWAANHGDGSETLMLTYGDLCGGDNGPLSVTGAGTSEPVVGSSVPAWPSPTSQLVVLVLRGSWGLLFECTTSTPKTLTTCGETSFPLLLKGDEVEQKPQTKPAKKPKSW